MQHPITAISIAESIISDTVSFLVYFASSIIFWNSCGCVTRIHLGKLFFCMWLIV
jgi:hypothetical protein